MLPASFTPAGALERSLYLTEFQTKGLGCFKSVNRADGTNSVALAHCAQNGLLARGAVCLHCGLPATLSLKTELHCWFEESLSEKVVSRSLTHIFIKVNLV